MTATEPFCTVDQYEARYGAVADEDQLSECLMDATRALGSALSSRGLDAESFDAGLLMQACRQMTNRVVPMEDAPMPIPAGATQVGMTGGPYSRQYSFQTPYGSPKVTAAEIDLLGLNGPRVGWLPLAEEDDG